MSSPSGSTSIAVAITARAIVAVQVRAAGDRLEVLARGEAETPRGAVRDGLVEDPLRVGEALRDLWRKMELRERAAAVVLPSSAYFMRALRLPELPERERRSVVRGELEQGGALPYGAGAFDFFWLRSGAQAEAFVYYTNDAAVEGVAEALRCAGLQVAALEPASVGIMRAYLAGRTDGRAVAILCPAEKHSDLCIHDGKEVRHLRRIPAGWADLRETTHAGASGIAPTDWRSRSIDNPALFLGIPDGETEEPGHGARPEPPLPTAVWSDQEFVLPEPASPQEPAAAPQPSRPPEQAVRQPAPEPRQVPFLVSEITRSLAFYAELVIVGPPAAAREYLALLASTQSIPVSAPPALREMSLPRAVPSLETEPELEGPLLAAIGGACGAAGLEWGLPALDLGGREVVLRKRAAGSTRVALAGIAGAAAWLALSAVAALGLTVLEVGAQAESSRLAEEIKRVEVERAPALRYQTVSYAAKRTHKKAHVPVSSVLGRVAVATNPGVSLETLDITADGKVSLGGTALDARSVERFASALGRGRSIQLPVPQSIQQRDDGRFTFKIGGRFKAPAGAANSGG
jgi:hypothetical protein